MALSALQWVLVYGTIVLQIVTLTVMIKRKFRSTFIFFFNFLAFSLLSNLLLEIAVVRHFSETAYFYLYWTITAVGTLLSFAVVYEVFVYILKPYSALVDLGKLLFRWALVFLALVSIVTAFSTAGSHANKICAIIQVLERSSELMQCGFLLLFVLFESRLGISWRSPAICIMLGLGGNSALTLTASFVQNHMPTWSSALDLIGAVGCVAVYICWCASFLLPQPERRTVQDSPSRLILQRWNEALTATPLVTARQQAAAFSSVESFLPGVERTVERVMARKMH